jgi:type IX secretion system PorP/SprF family membrane protein
MRKLIYICLWMVAMMGAKAHHYSTYSQYIINGLAINPAYAGRNNVLDVTAAHRRQWIGFTGAPVTTAFSLNTPLKVKAVSLGLSVIDDKIGPFNNQMINAIYAYRVKFRKFKLSFGIQNGIFIKKINYDALIRNQQQDALINNQRQLEIGFLSGAGMYAHSKNMFVGISAPYLVNTLNNDFLLENPILLTGGYFIGIDREHGLKPSLLVRYINNSPLSADINLNYYYKTQFGFGLSYRTNKTMVGIAEFGINQQFRVCYSYDCELSRLKKYQSGSHEILLRYYFGYSVNAKNPRTMFL